MIFTNLHLPETQKQIKLVCAGKSGVYLITNLRNNNRYIGCAISKKITLNRLYMRFRNHFFHLHKPFPITRVVKKYGVHAFSWQILEFTEISTTRTRETFYIQSLRPEYNVSGFLESSRGFSPARHTRERMVSRYSEERRLRIGGLNPNCPLSPEVRENLSRAAQNRTAEQKTRARSTRAPAVFPRKTATRRKRASQLRVLSLHFFNKKMHEKWREACTAFNKKQFSKATQVLDQTGKVCGTYSSLRQACRKWNGDYRTFKRIVKSGTLHCKLKIYVKYVS